MNYFLNNSQPQKPISDQDLMALALQNMKNTKAQLKKKRRKHVVAVPLSDLKKHREIIKKTVYAKILMLANIDIIRSHYFWVNATL